MILSNLLVPTLLWLGQSPGITFLAPTPPGPQPDYARPVVHREQATIPPDPVIVCVHRPGDLPYDAARVDHAAGRILQVVKWSRLREAETIASLGPPAESDRRLVPRRPPSPEERMRRRAMARAIDQHWQLFEARLYEVRMFQHRPEEGQLAARRTGAAWDALLGLIQQYPDPLPADLIDEVEVVDGLVGVVRSAGG